MSIFRMYATVGQNSAADSKLHRLGYLPTMEFRPSSSRVTAIQGKNRFPMNTKAEIRNTLMRSTCLSYAARFLAWSAIILQRVPRSSSRPQANAARRKWPTWVVQQESTLRSKKQPTQRRSWRRLAQLNVVQESGFPCGLAPVRRSPHREQTDRNLAWRRWPIVCRSRAMPASGIAGQMCKLPQGACPGQSPVEPDSRRGSRRRRRLRQPAGRAFGRTPTRRTAGFAGVSGGGKPFTGQDGCASN